MTAYSLQHRATAGGEAMASGRTVMASCVRATTSVGRWHPSCDSPPPRKFGSIPHKSPRCICHGQIHRKEREVNTEDGELETMRDPE